MARAVVPAKPSSRRVCSAAARSRSRVSDPRWAEVSPASEPSRTFFVPGEPDLVAPRAVRFVPRDPRAEPVTALRYQVEEAFGKRGEPGASQSVRPRPVSYRGPQAGQERGRTHPHPPRVVHRDQLLADPGHLAEPGSCLGRPGRSQFNLDEAGLGEEPVPAPP